MGIDFKRNYREIILAVLVLAIIGPILYFRAPWFFSSPDIAYVKAKVLQILAGGLYTDPITGYATFHPPFYHLVLAPFKAVGFEFNTILVGATILNVGLMMLFAYKALGVAFGRTAAFFACLLLPFIVEFMGCRNILLATAFYFSVPFYLAGLWLYFLPDMTDRRAAGVAALWGAAFLISPVYLFLVGLTFLYELIIRKNRRRFLIMGGTFLATLIPFFVQAAVIYSRDLWGASAFALWRGIPNSLWWTRLGVETISPGMAGKIGPPTIAHVVVIVCAVWLMIRDRKIHWYLPVSLAAYLLTFYHYNADYAIRIHLFFSLVLVGGMIAGLRKRMSNPVVWMIPIVALSVAALGYHEYNSVIVLRKEGAVYKDVQAAGRELWASMKREMKPGEYIFCEKAVYREYVMPFFLVHSLGAYRSMEYYQLNPRVAAQIETDYQAAFASDDIAVIEQIAARYGITAAIVSGRSHTAPLFRTLVKHWKTVHHSGAFSILRKP
jgi:hypothetical protein